MGDRWTAPDKHRLIFLMESICSLIIKHGQALGMLIGAPLCCVDGNRSGLTVTVRLKP